MSQNYSYKDPFDFDFVVVRTSHQTKVILRQGRGLFRQTGALLMCILYPALNGQWLVRRYKTK